MNDDSRPSDLRRGAFRFRASQLIDCKVGNARQEALGSLQDIVLASDNLRIAYAVVAFGGFLGMGEKLFAMPWRLLEVTAHVANTRPRIQLAADQDLLKAAPGFDKDQWPDLADTTWSQQVDAFYRNRGGLGTAGAPQIQSWASPAKAVASGPSGRGSDPDGKKFHFRRVSQLLGMQVVGTDQAVLAKIEDLIVDTERALLVGAALGFGGVLGIGKETALVPMANVSLDRFRGNFAMACTAAQLHTLALPDGDWSQIDRDDWLSREPLVCDGTSKAKAAPRSAAASVD
jgi:sporulation protein YlmC with PRC-barrel domain